MPKPGGPGKAPSTFDPNKKGLKNKNDRNKFGTSSSNGKRKELTGIKPTGNGDYPNPPCTWCCIGCTGTADLNCENIEL